MIFRFPAHLLIYKSRSFMQSFNWVNEEDSGAQRLLQNNYTLYCWSRALNSRAETLGTVKGNCGRRIYVRHGTNVKPLQRRMSGKQIAITTTVLMQRRLQVLILCCPLTDFMGTKRRKNSRNTTLTVLFADLSTFQDFVYSTEGRIFVLPQTIVLKQRKIRSLAAAQQMKLQVFLFFFKRKKKLKDRLEKKQRSLNLETSQMDVFRWSVERGVIKRICVAAWEMSAKA